MTKNNAYKGIQSWLEALLKASKDNTLGDWWNARTLECVNLGIELSVAGELAVYKDGLDFTKALFQAAKDGSLMQSDVDYNVNQLLMIRWKFQTDFFHLEEHELDVSEPLEGNSEDPLTEFLEEAIIEFTATASVEASIEAPPVVQEVVVAPPKKALGGRPKRVTK